MRLRTFRVRGFRCIRDTAPVSVRDLAVLIGKNENGKTAMLQALSHLNKDNPFRAVDLCDEMYEELANGIRVVEGEFDLTEPEVASLRERFSDCPEIKRVRIFRANKPDKIEYEFPDVPELPARTEVLEKPATTFKKAITDLRDVITADEEEFKKGGASADFSVALQTLKEIEGFRELGPLGLAPKVNSLKADLPPQTLEKAAVNAALSKLEQGQAALFRQVSRKEEITEFVSQSLHPRFVYFSEYKKLHGQINLPSYISGAEQPSVVVKEVDIKETIDNLFYLAGLEAKHLDEIKANPDERVKYLAECGARLTKALEPTWLTQKIEVEFEYAENLLVVKVSDLHSDGTRTNKGLLKRRSEGFRWHFSFFVNFTAEVQKAELREAVLLLDEPGLHLHPAQQLGMLSILKKLASKNQVLYTTHSPFMILDYDVGSLLTVELEETTHLSRIQPAYWKGDPETALLVLHALGGHTLADAWARSLAKVSSPALIVEGPSDYMYLKVMLEVVRKKRNKSKIEIPFDAELVPANGSSAIAPLAMFHQEKGFKVAVVYDNEPQARKYSEGLIAQGFDQKNVFFSEVEGKTESDIEDFFSETEYIAALNEDYSEILKNARYVPIEKRDLKTLKEKNRAINRIVPLLEAHWKEHDGWGDFDKSTVCRKLCEKALSDRGFLAEDTIRRFEIQFSRIQSALSPQDAPASGAPAQPAEEDTSQAGKRRRG